MTINWWVVIVPEIVLVVKGAPSFYTIRRIQNKFIKKKKNVINVSQSLNKKIKKLGQLNDC